MHIAILSDLHTEMAPFDAEGLEAEVIVLAGDIGKGVRGVEFASEAFSSRHVIYVAGNHEYYGGAIPHTTDAMREVAEARGLHFLEQDEVVIDGVRFLGVTLWTDFAVYGESESFRSMEIAREGLNDFRLIRKSPQFSRFSPGDARTIFLKSRAWLKARLAEPFPGPTVVVTHHAPSLRSCPERYRGSPLTPAFISDVEFLMGRDRVRLWIHGHTHHCVNYEIRGTHVVSNQRGYPDEPVEGFSPSFTWTLE